MASTASKVPRTGLTSRAATAATAATIPTLASLGVKINRSKVVDADTGQVYRADVQFGASSSRNERGHIAYEGVVQASQNVGVETFLSPLPPPELGVKQHWSEQKHETEGGEGLAERKGYGLERRRLPLGTKETENGSTILVSPNFGDAEKLFVFVPNGTTGLGSWNRQLAINGPIESGLMVKAVDLLLARFASFDESSTEVTAWPTGPGSVGLVILNPGEQCWINGRSVTMAAIGVGKRLEQVKGCMSVEAHVDLVFRDIVLPSKADKIFILASEWGSVAVDEVLAKNLAAFKNRVWAIAMMQSQHTRNAARDAEEYVQWFRERSVNYAASYTLTRPLPKSAGKDYDSGSDEDDFGPELPASGEKVPLGEPFLDLRKGCISVSAGTDKSEMIPLTAMERIFTYFVDVDAAPSPEQFSKPSLDLWDKAEKAAIKEVQAADEDEAEERLLSWAKVKQAVEAV